MSEASEAAEQVVRMMLSGGEIAVRLSGSALKNGAALLLALAKNHKNVFGKINLSKMLGMTRDIRTFALTPEQYNQFRKRAKRMKILYSAVQDKHNKNAPVDVILPTFELERANVIFEQIRFVPENEKQTEQAGHDEPQNEEKNASRSEPDSKDTKDNFSTRTGRERKMNERPSVEQKLKENKAFIDKQHHQAPTKQRQRTKKRTKGKSK
ncbi:MAG: DUF3801 domain-containing protein [Christensenellaceae bacterium]|nr:DUF3801 domain-containing protein [Christensenellaceae bacterium]